MAKSTMRERAQTGKAVPSSVFHHIIRLTKKRVLLLLLSPLLFTPTLLSPSPGYAEEDIIIFDTKKKSREKAGVGLVRFPHKAHKKIMKCAVCHPKIFKAKLGANNISMKMNMDGEFCGRCHNGLDAFPLFQCKSCHVDVKDLTEE